MHPRRMIHLGVLVLAAGASACARDTEGVQREDTSALKALVAEEATNEFALSPGEQIVSPATVRLEDGPRVQGLRTYRAWVPRDHWHAYQLAVSGNTVFVLGGFQNPDLASAATALAGGAGGAMNLRDVAERLALLADNSGGVQYAFPGRTDFPAVSAAWRNMAPDTWPHDTVTELGNGRRIVRLTLLSQETRSYTQHWTPTAYALTFNADGQLRAWSRRAGVPVPATKIPVARSGGPVSKP